MTEVKMEDLSAPTEDNALRIKTRISAGCLGPTTENTEEVKDLPLIISSVTIIILIIMIINIVLIVQKHYRSEGFPEKYLHHLQRVSDETSS